MVPFGNRNIFNCELCMLLPFQKSTDKVIAVQIEAGTGTWNPSEVQRAKPPLPAAPADVPQYSLPFPRLFFS